MPFTFSHPAIVLPLARLPKRWVSVTGLVVGSVTPDFEYFLKMHVGSIYSHTLKGLFWYDLPLGLLLAFVFHYLVRNSLFDNLPRTLITRLAPYRSFDWGAHFKKHWGAVLFSLLVGAASHLFWDSFTHKRGFFVNLFPILKTPVRLGGIKFLPFQTLQHLSTLVGGVVIAYTLYRMPLNKVQQWRREWPKYWSLVLCLTGVIMAIRFFNGLNIREHGNVIVTGIAAGLLSLMLTPVFLRRRKEL